MTRKPWDSDRHRAWKLFLSVSAELAHQLDGELQQNHEMTLIDYEILSGLCRAEERRLRMSDLAALVQVSRSRLTYRVDLLVDVGFVRREECEDDRRGMWAIVTETGRRAHDGAKPEHEGSIDAWFFEQMSLAEQASFNQVLTRVADKLSLRAGPSA